MKNYLLLSACLFLLASCAPEEKPTQTQTNSLILRLGAVNSGTSEAVDPRQIHDLTGCLFDNGYLKSLFSGLSVSDAGILHGIELGENQEAVFYLLANTESALSHGKLIPGSLSEEQFRKLVISLPPSSEEGAAPFLTGNLRVSDLMKKNGELLLTRGIARFDIQPGDGLQVISVRASGVAGSSYLLPQESVESPQDTERIELARTYKNPLEAETEGIFFLNEQTTVDACLSIDVKTADRSMTLTASLPAQIKRNHIYTIHVAAGNNNGRVAIQEQPWDTNDVTETKPDLTTKIRVNVNGSDLPNGVEVSESREEVFVPCYGETFTLALDTKADVEVRLVGEDVANSGVTVTPLADAGGGSLNSQFRVTTSRAPISGKERVLYLEVRNKNLSQYYGDRIKLVVQPRKIQYPKNIMDLWDGNFSFNMKEYMDGDFGVAELSDGSTLSFQPIDADGKTSASKWIKLEPITDHIPGQPASQMGNGLTSRYRVLVGYRPNDPEADGRIQRGVFTVTYPNGRTESDTISRPNQGLPVVDMGYRYWCKFNLRGNARSFEDQIKINDSAARVEDLYQYLRTCPSEEYIRIIGDAYKGRNTTGLKLKLNETDRLFFYENYEGTEAGGLINSSKATEHCPPGYQLPDHTDDIVKLFGSRVIKFSNGENSAIEFPTADGIIKMAYRHIRYGIEYDGGRMPRVIFNQLEYTTGEQVRRLVFCGSGVQSGNNGRVNPAFNLFAAVTAGNSSATLHAGEDKIAIENRSVNDTRTIRCIKTPVEYIY